MAADTHSDSDDGMDEFMDKFKTQRYKNAFSENSWEEEFNTIPMFMKTAPEEIDPKKYPELACLQSIIHDDDRSPEEQAKILKDEGNAFFKEKNYKKAIISYTVALKKKCGDEELNAVLLTNRAASHFHLGNMRSALNDAAAAKKIKPGHLKALIRGAQCCIELRNFSEAVQWCDEGLKEHSTDEKLRELRATADKHKRAADRDARKVKAKQKKLHSEKQALLSAIQNRGIKLLQSTKPHLKGSESEDDEDQSSAAMEQLSLDGLSSQEVTGAQVFLDEKGSLHWPVLFLYPEHQQSDFISAFCDVLKWTYGSWTYCLLFLLLGIVLKCFKKRRKYIQMTQLQDHLNVMFGAELPPWDSDRKYFPQNLQLYFEDCEKETLYQVDPEMSLLKTLQHKRCFVKAGTPSFIVLVEDSSFFKQFLSGKRVHAL